MPAGDTAYGGDAYLGRLLMARRALHEELVEGAVGLDQRHRGPPFRFCRQQPAHAMSSPQQSRLSDARTEVAARASPRRRHGGMRLVPVTHTTYTVAPLKEEVW